jgi:uncharacterized damage-inducible protein DinB
MHKVVLIAALPLLCATVVSAQAGKEAAGGIQAIYSSAKGYLVRAAEQVPEDKYAYKPVATVRSFGAIMAHLADSNFAFCATAAGKPTAEGSSIEQTAKTKAQIVAKLKESYAACDAVYSAMTDAGLVKKTTLFGSPATVSQVLVLNAGHNEEHYGNVVTYMRMMGMVPPSSQGGN